MGNWNNTDIWTVHIFPGSEFRVCTEANLLTDSCIPTDQQKQQCLTGGEAIGERLWLALLVQGKDGHWVLHQRRQITEVVRVHVSHLHLHNMHRHTYKKIKTIKMTNASRCVIWHEVGLLRADHLCLCKTHTRPLSNCLSVLSKMIYYCTQYWSDISTKRRMIDTINLLRVVTHLTSSTHQ